MSTKRSRHAIEKGRVVDISAKKDFTVIFDNLEISSEEHKKEQEQLEMYLEQIRQSQYTLNAAITRVQSRTFKDIFLAWISCFLKSKNHNIPPKMMPFTKNGKH